MSGFTTLYLTPADTPAPWTVVVKPTSKRKKHWSGKMKIVTGSVILINDAEGMFVAEVDSKLAADAIVSAINKLAAEDAS